MRRTSLLFCTLLPLAGTLPGQPVVTRVLHAANLTPPGAPGYAMAPNTLLAITGLDLGPSQEVSLSIFHSLPIELGGTSVKVRVGATELDAKMLSAQAQTVHAVLPNDTPLGSGTLTVTYAGRTSQPSRVFPVVARALGLFSLNGLGYGSVYALNRRLEAISTVNPLFVDQPAFLFATGLGRRENPQPPHAFSKSSERLTNHTSISVPTGREDIREIPIDFFSSGFESIDIGTVETLNPNGINEDTCVIGLQSPGASTVDLHVKKTDDTVCPPPGFTPEQWRQRAADVLKDPLGLLRFIRIFRDYGSSGGGVADSISMSARSITKGALALLPNNKPGDRIREVFQGRNQAPDASTGQGVNLGNCSFRMGAGPQVNFQLFGGSQYSANLSEVPGSRNGGPVTVSCSGLSDGPLTLNLPPINDAPIQTLIESPSTNVDLTNGLQFNRISPVFNAANQVHITLSSYNGTSDFTARLTGVFRGDETVMKFNTGDLAPIVNACFPIDVTFVEQVALPIPTPNNQVVATGLVRLFRIVQLNPASTLGSNPVRCP